MKKIILNFSLLLNLGIICIFWWDGSGSLFQGTRSDILIATARISGLLSVFFVLLQLILIGRVKWLEHVYGLDKLSHAHHLTAFLSIFFIFIHALFVTSGYALGSSVGFFGQISNFINYFELLPAMVAMSLFTLVFVSSLVIVFKKLKYEIWYLVHLFSYLAILLAFEHQMELGGDFIGNTYFRIYWISLYTFTLGNLFFYRFFLPAYNFYKHRFTVEKIEQENATTTSIYISGKNLNKFKYNAGQFAIWKFLDKQRFLQAHPFSFSSNPNDNLLRITVKNLGDFTSKMSEIKIGTKVVVDGPHGIFTTKRTKNRKLAFIAGGVGITPIHSILSNMDQNYQSILFNCTRTTQDIIFQKEIPKLKEKNIKIITVLSAEENNQAENGYMDQEKIKRLAPDYLERDFYVCGPKPMMQIVVKELIKLGIAKNKIYFEKFSLG